MRLLLLVVCLAHPALCEGRHWVRRLTLAASCAASFWDVQTTRAAVARGGREANGFFADANGNPRWGRMIGVKAGLCGAMALVEELGFRSRARGSPVFRRQYRVGGLLHRRGAPQPRRGARPGLPPQGERVTIRHNNESEPTGANAQTPYSWCEEPDCRRFRKRRRRQDHRFGEPGGSAGRARLQGGAARCRRVRAATFRS